MSSSLLAILARSAPATVRPGPAGVPPARRRSTAPRSPADAPPGRLPVSVALPGRVAAHPAPGILRPGHLALSAPPARRRSTASALLALAGGALLACALAGPTPLAAQNDTVPPPWEWSEERIRSAVGAVRAGRDLTPETWPGGARVAVALSFDVDNETIPLRTGDTGVGALSRGEYGARVGLGRVLDLMEREGIPASFFIPAWSLKLAPEMADAIQASPLDHEIAVHGYIHERNTLLDAATERRLVEQAVEILTEITGERPVGYRAPSWDMSPATLDIVRDLGFLYESSLMADDRPYELVQDGEPTGLVELPVEWILDDAPLMNPLGDRYSPPREVAEVWKDEFDVAHREGTMFLLTMHPHYIGHRSRIVALEELVRHMKDRGSVWFATHEDVARYVRERAGMGPHAGAGR